MSDDEKTKRLTSFAADGLSRIAALTADNARLRGVIDDVVCGRGMFGLSADDDLKWAMQHLGSALTGKADT